MERLTPRQKKGMRGQGVALLMSLSVILLLSVALMKTFEKRSLEVAQLGHNLDRFQAENLSRSGLKLILYAIRKAGLVTMNAYLTQLKEIDFPVGNGTMKILEITPIDHRFNLNVKINREDDPRVSVFSNLVSMSRALQEDLSYLSQENTNEALSAIIDWIDIDDTRDEIFLYDAEMYPHEEPAFEVKNREFDRLSEVRLLPTFRNLGMKPGFLENHFRVSDNSETEFVDVNLTSLEVIRQFLKRYEDVEGYPHMLQHQEEILQIIESRRMAGIEVSTDGFTPVEAVFPAKEFQRDWNLDLENIGINLNEKEKDLFKPYSNNLFIHYRVTVGVVTLSIRSMVQVSYRDPNKTLDIDQLRVLWVRIT